MPTTTLQLGDLAQARQAALRANEILAAGGLVVFPTETVYGVAASAAGEKGYERLRALRGAPAGQPFTIHIAAGGVAERYVDFSSPVLRRLIHKVFPGPVTLVVDVDPAGVAERAQRLGLTPAEAGKVFANNTVALRCPDHEAARLMLESAAAPVIASSASRPGQPPALTAREAAAALGDAVDLVIDGGPCRFGKPSTMVRVRGLGTATHFEVERAGVYDQRYIHKMLRWTMLLVCSGNTCRSPMAEVIARKVLADQRKLAPDELEAAGLRVLSAGTSAASGAPANRDAVETMGKMGLDLSKHRSRPVSAELVHDADVIFCMTEAHRQDILSAWPEARDKVLLLDPNGDIDDPFGRGLTVYQRTAEIIRRRLERQLQEHQP